MPTKPIYFASPAEFRAWLAEHHERASEVFVGYYKRATGKPTMTWQESVAEALCYGWIDGIRRSIDDERYMNRFTPRRPTSNWSAVNIKAMQELIASGRAAPAGLRAFEQRREERSGIYAYENRKNAQLSTEDEATFRRNRKAWRYFERCAPSYRHTAIWHVVTAKRPDTRARRLASLIESCEQERPIGVMARPTSTDPAPPRPKSTRKR